MTLSADAWEIILLSLKISAAAILVALPFAFLFAFLLARRQFPCKLLVDGLVHLPLVLPPVVVGWLLLIAFGRNGPVGGWLYEMFGISLMFRWTGAALAAAVMAFPLMVRALRLGFEGVDRRLEQAARTLGAGRARVFFTITLPLALPALLTATVLGFARSLGEFGATITFVSNIPGETRTLPIAIYSALQIPGGETVAARLAIVSILLSLGALVLSEALARRHARASHVL